MELDQGKIINCVPDRILHKLSKTILATILCQNKTVLDRLRLLVSVSIPLTILGIVSVSYRFKKAGIAHPYSEDSSLHAHRNGFHKPLCLGVREGL